MPGIWMPTAKQLRHTYTTVVRSQAEQPGGLKKLASAPKTTFPMSSYKNVGVPGMRGHEDIFTDGIHLYVRNTRGGKISWFDAGFAPQF